MTTYSIDVKIDSSWIHKFQASGTKLCFSFGVVDSTGSNSPMFNVVAITQNVAPNVQTSWTDNFSIAGGNESFTNGVQVNATTGSESIRPQQSVTLQQSWMLGPAVSDPSLGPGQLKFINQPVASAILYKQAQGRQISFYMTQNGPNPPGDSILTPKPVARLYFARNDPGTLIDDFQTTYIDVDLTNQTQAQVSYSDDGTWSQSG